MADANTGLDVPLLGLKGHIAPIRDEIRPDRVVDRAHFIMGPGVERCERRDALATCLKAREIGCEAYYPVPLDFQGCFAPLRGGPGQFPEAEQAARGGLAPPICPVLTTGKLATVVSAISSIYS